MLTSTIVALTAISSALAVPVSPYVRRGGNDASGAITLSSILACPIIARAGFSSSACPTEHLADHFPHIFGTRAGSVIDGMIARDEDSGALTLPSFIACPIIARAGFSSSACPEEQPNPFNHVWKARGSDNMMARDDGSEALSLSTVGTLVSVAAPVIGGIIDHFANKQQRDYFVEELLARSMLEELD